MEIIFFFRIWIWYKLLCKFSTIFKLVICASRKITSRGWSENIYVSSKLCERRQSLYTKLSISFKKKALWIYFFVLLWLTLCFTTYINHLHILFFRQQLKDKMQEESDFEKDEVCMFPILKKILCSKEQLCSWKLLIWQ